MKNTFAKTMFLQKYHQLCSEFEMFIDGPVGSTLVIKEASNNALFDSDDDFKQKMEASMKPFVKDILGEIGISE
jgi:hypothetical protein